MKQKLVSGLGILLVLPAFAGARLPAVNTTRAAVSARAQYGVVPVVAKSEIAKPVAVENASRTATNKKRVVARAAKPKTAQTSAKNVSADSGEKIAANNEYLVPNRPSSDLWAKNDTPLRMPRANEFSVITSNDALP